MTNKESDSNNSEDESKRDKKLIKIRKHFSRREIINAILLSVVLSIIFVAVSVGSLYSLYEPCRQFIVNVAPNVLECDFVNKTSYYVISLVLIFGLLILVVRIIFKKIAPRRVVRDKDYILDLFDDRGSSSPVPTREALIKNIYGEGWDMKDEESYKSISEAIDNNVERIKEFLVSDDRNNILSLNGEWGSGKTTALLIAINETDDDNNRYIYEAAFKYTSNLDEFFNDLLSAFSDSLAAVKKMHEFIYEESDRWYVAGLKGWSGYKERNRL